MTNQEIVEAPEAFHGSAAWREMEYSPSSAIGGNYAPFVARYASDSALAYAHVRAQRDLRYGSAPRCLIDFFPANGVQAMALPHSSPLPSGESWGEGEAHAVRTGAETRPGLLVFIHGGYWQELSKSESAFLAPAWCEAGFAHAVIGYTLAPQASLHRIVAECVAAITWLQARAGELGFDPRRIVVAGSSAGAYLAAACARAAIRPLAGIVLISGIYDLTPLLGTSINTALGLQPADVPLLNLVAADIAKTRAVVAWGEVETSEFKRQSRELASGIQARGGRCKAFEISGRNHFDVVHELAEPTAHLFTATLDLFSPVY